MANPCGWSASRSAISHANSLIVGRTVTHLAAPLPLVWEDKKVGGKRGRSHLKWHYMSAKETLFWIKCKKVYTGHISANTTPACINKHAHARTHAHTHTRTQSHTHLLDHDITRALQQAAQLGVTIIMRQPLSMHLLILVHEAVKGNLAPRKLVQESLYTFLTVLLCICSEKGNNSQFCPLLTIF